MGNEKVEKWQITCRECGNVVDEFDTKEEADAVPEEDRICACCDDD